MTDERKTKKAAQAIQAMLELDGVKTTVKNVAEQIEGEDLTDLNKLKDKLANDMRPAETATSQPDRRRAIGDFVVTNWDLIKDNEHVKSALLHTYCMGRYKKEQRETMAQELLARVGVEPEQKDEEPKQEAPKIEEANQEDVKPEDQDYKQYTF